MDETGLIRRAQSGEREAFEALIETHYDAMYRFAYQWCGNVSDAQDVVQLACIKVARSLSQFRFESSFKTWLYRLVVNCAKDWYRSESRHEGGAAPTHDAVPELVSTTTDAEGGVFLTQVLKQLETMAEGYKETALLVHGQGFSHAEAASLLGVKESTVSWRLHEIKKQLKHLSLGGAV